MNPKALEAAMREREAFSALRLLAGAWTVIRLDGRAFTLFTGARFAKPFDERFRDAMVRAAHALFEDFGAIYASTHSDEISVALPPDWERFGRRLEKVVSVAAGAVSAAFTHAVGEPAHFDGRVWQAATDSEVAAYFRWRQDDASRCALHAWCYWTLCREGMEREAARAELDGKGHAEQCELLAKRGIDFGALPAWQRHGVGLYRVEQEKEGYNPLTHAHLRAMRHVVNEDLDLPAREAYERMMLELLRGRRMEISATTGSEVAAPPSGIGLASQ